MIISRGEVMVFKKLFWGFIFLFDFRINGFDILPDIIGYILFFQGLSILASRNIYFEKAKRLSFPLIFLSIFSIYENTTPLAEFSINNSTSLLMLLGLVITILHLFMVYNICMGIADEARLFEKPDLEDKAMMRWTFYLVINIAVIFVIFIAFVLPTFGFVLLILSLILSVISYILMVMLMNDASNEIEEPYKIE